MLWFKFIAYIQIIWARSNVIFLVSLFKKASSSMNCIPHCSNLGTYFYLSLGIIYTSVVFLKSFYFFITDVTFIAFFQVKFIGINLMGILLLWLFNIFQLCLYTQVSLIFYLFSIPLIVEWTLCADLVYSGSDSI